MLDFLLIFPSFTFRIQFPPFHKTDCLPARVGVVGKEAFDYKRRTPLTAYQESLNILLKFLSNSGATYPGSSWENQGRATQRLND